MNEEEHMRGACLIARPHPLSKKVARPQGLRVCPQELIPREPMFGRLWTDTRLDEEPPDRRSGDAVHTDICQLPEIALKAKTAFLGGPRDQHAHLGWFAWRAGLSLYLRGWPLPQPSRVGLRLHDRDQLLDGGEPSSWPKRINMDRTSFVNCTHPGLCRGECCSRPSSTGTVGRAICERSRR